MIPDKPGLWWRQVYSDPVWVVEGPDGLEWRGVSEYIDKLVIDDGQWIANCVKPLTAYPTTYLPGVWAWVSRGCIQLGEWAELDGRIVFERLDNGGVWNEAAWDAGDRLIHVEG